MLLLIQIFTVLVAIALAWANKRPVLKMIDFGASLNEEKEFHAANAAVKILFAISLTFNSGLSCVLSCVFFLNLLLIQWLVFDIALNAFLKKDNWLYIGETATIDKALRFGITIHLKTKKILIPGFGDLAGLIKLLVVSSILLVINFFLK
jgi:hypothetical protein